MYERKPSQSELQNAWQNETQYDSYGHTATDQPTWHYNEQDHRATQPAMYQAPHNGYDDSAQHASSTDPYSGHYGQTGTVHQESSHSYAPHDTGYSKDSYQQVANAYEPYQANALSNTPNYQGMNGETANDRERPRNRPAVPIASFGFNGKLVTFFPSSAAPATASYGMMYEDPSSGSTIKIQKLSEILPTALSGFDSFPGPLFMDTGATSASGKAKKKKDILAWLHARIEESQQERNYLGVSASDTAKAQADQKTVVLQLLKILLENDGKLTGTLQVDQLVQQVLVPHLATSGQNSAFAVAADLGNNNYETSAKSVPQATSRDLDTIQTHLLRGEKREAVQYALNNRLYSHALVIASGTDRALLTEVVQDFLAFELGGELAQGREALKVAYSLLSGGGPAASE